MNVMPVLEGYILSSTKLRAKTREGRNQFRHRQLYSRLHQQVTLFVLLKSTGEQTLIDRSQNFLSLIRQQIYEIHRYMRDKDGFISTVNLSFLECYYCNRSHFLCLSVCLLVTPVVSGSAVRIGNKKLSSVRHTSQVSDTFSRQKYLL